MTKPLAVVAVGGNALISDDQHMALADQYDAVCATAAHVATMVDEGWNVVLTHGNGPQVGFILRRSEIADGQVVGLTSFLDVAALFPRWGLPLGLGAAGEIARPAMGRAAVDGLGRHRPRRG